MYGIIHKSVRSFVLANHGEEMWKRIQASCELASDSSLFLSSAHFDDAKTFEFISKVATVLEVEVETALHAVGLYWTEFVITEGYGDLFDMAGSTFPEFLHNLNRMHSSLKITLTKAVMPSFELLGETDRAFVVRYMSERRGLSKFVQGLLKGVAFYYGEETEVDYCEIEGGATFHIERKAKLTPSDFETRADRARYISVAA